ncbi:hypothetical protein IFM58399_03242 [Aspergillus lentulus]|uniref:putative integral membrane protein (Pth11) n=1 Tax=Aspergillus lentulus TaxID=293939 RepID=UPI0013955188|nr:uncharacterized protein IFM58399_03242 [Aspergillus lentulus]GFF32528.1 hypothetical protein IFM58399_03242 [Aspergillus lentulus]GFF56247.1 hypothetical protein IFM62136_03069 [Aspergillus lentulus]
MDLSKTPAFPPPPGVTPNFENPERIDYDVYSINIAMCLTGTFVLGLRMYTRGVILRTVAIDDWFCIAAQVCAWIFAILGFANIQNGYGVHIWDLYLIKLKPFKQNDLAAEDIFALGIWFVKTSILLFYLRLNPERRFRQWTYGIMAFVFIYSLISILVFTCGCIPVTAMWDMTQMATAKCVDQLAFVYANAAFNLLSDLMTLILPIKLCWSLQTTLKQKVLLCLVLAMGSFACVIAIVRIVTMMPFVHSMDFTWYKVTLAKWAMVEINVGIICACLPVLRPLLLRIFPKLAGSKNSSGDKHTDESYALQESGSKKKKKGIRNWDYLTTVGGTQNPREDDVESLTVRPNGKSDSQEGIIMSTETKITYH